MILAIDIGNTNITCGLFANDNLVKSFRLPTDISITANRYAEIFKAEIGTSEIKGAVIGSVVDDITDRVIFAVKSTTKIEPIVLTYKSKMPITLSLKNNSELGSDRIANGIRAWNLFKKTVIVVDFGTATTFDIVNSKGEFIGGMISPGVKTQLKSLSDSTSLLDEFEPDDVDFVIGNCTKNAILSGVIRGIACMVDGMIEQTEFELGEKPILIATGGFSKIITKYMKRKFDLISPHLTLEGLNDLYHSNI